MNKQTRNVVGVLPTPVLAVLLDIDTTNILNAINDSSIYKNEFGNQASQNYQLLEEEVFADLKKALLKECEFYCTEVQNYLYDSLFITTSWFNRNTPGTSHHLHRHPNSIVSGVFYVKAPKGGGDLVFARNTEMLAPNRKEMLSGHASDFSAVEPEDNLLLLFPSYLNHFVTPNNSSENRISISFNTFFRGELGFGSGLTYLKV